MDLPALFDNRGQFIGDQWPADVLDSLPADRRKLFDDVKEAAAASKAADDAVRAATDTVHECAARVAADENAIKQNTISFHQLWLSVVKGNGHG